MVRERNEHEVFRNKFFYLSADDILFYRQWYGQACGHVIKSLDDNTWSCCSGGLFLCLNNEYSLFQFI